MLKQTKVISAEWIAAQDVRRWLTGREQAQGQSFTSERRRADWRAGRLAVKKMLCEYWDTDPLACEVGTDGIAPVVTGSSLPAINISLSHCAGWGAASWEHNSRGVVGVDIQHVRPVHPRLAERVLSASEQTQFEAIEKSHLLLFWALKEAAIKASRRPYRHALREIVVTLLADGRASLMLPEVEKPLHAEFLWTEGAWLARAVLPPGD